MSMAKTTIFLQQKLINSCYKYAFKPKLDLYLNKILIKLFKFDQPFLSLQTLSREKTFQIFKY